MSQRPHATIWLWCLLALYTGPSWAPVGSVSVRTPPKNPSTIEAQAKFFQYRHLPTHEDYDQGHRQGSDRHFTERHERSRPSDGLFSAKVRWGDKQGGYGEHYWDLNHAGHGNNHGSDEYDGNSDDGSYNHDLDHAHDNDGHDNHDAYDEPSEQLPSYGTEDYDPEKAAQYDESARAKRAHPRVKTERKFVREEKNYEDEPHQQPQPQRIQPQRIQRKIKERLQAAPTEQVEKVTEKPDAEQQPPKKKRQQRRPQNPQQSASDSEHVTNEDNLPKEAPNHHQPALNHQQSEKTQYYTKKQPENHHQQVLNLQESENPQYYVKRQPDNKFVPYEQGAGVRQHHQPDISAAASVPRLFLEPTTGHVVDRATGQAYVLQPIAMHNYN